MTKKEFLGTEGNFKITADRQTNYECRPWYPDQTDMLFGQVFDSFGVQVSMYDVTDKGLTLWHYVLGKKLTAFIAWKDIELAG